MSAATIVGLVYLAIIAASAGAGAHNAYRDERGRVSAVDLILGMGATALLWAIGTTVAVGVIGGAIVWAVASALGV
jgi:hypothetical protein